MIIQSGFFFSFLDLKTALINWMQTLYLLESWGVRLGQEGLGLGLGITGERGLPRKKEKLRQGLVLRARAMVMVRVRVLGSG